MEGKFHMPSTPGGHRSMMCALPAASHSKYVHVKSHKQIEMRLLPRTNQFYCCMYDWCYIILPTLFICYLPMEDMLCLWRCLFVCQQDYRMCYGRILLKFCEQISPWLRTYSISYYLISSYSMQLQHSDTLTCSIL